MAALACAAGKFFCWIFFLSLNYLEGGRVHHDTCGDRGTTFPSQFSPSVLSGPGIEPTSSDSQQAPYLLSHLTGPLILPLNEVTFQNLNTYRGLILRTSTPVPVLLINTETDAKMSMVGCSCGEDAHDGCSWVFGCV